MIWAKRGLKRAPDDGMMKAANSLPEWEESAMDTRITKAKLKNHWHYSWWKYMAAAIICGLLVDMLFAMTQYRPPANKKIELYLCNGYADAMIVHEELWPKLQAAAPDQEELTVLNINLRDEDMYANMQFTTYVGAQQGDVLLLPVSSVKNLAAEGADGAYMELTPFIESGLLDVGDLDLSAGMMPAEDGEMGLYAIPTDTLYGLTAANCDPAGGMLVVMGYSMNPENAVKTIDLLFDLYQTEKPDWYDAMQQEKNEQAAQQTQLFR